MSEASDRISAISSGATSNVHHAQLSNLPLSVEQKLYHGGVGSGELSRTTAEAQAMLDKIQPACRALKTALLKLLQP